VITQVNSGVLNVHKAHMNNNTKKEAKNTSQKQNSVRDGSYKITKTLRTVGGVHDQVGW
jgi:hypothetical protein